MNFVHPSQCTLVYTLPLDRERFYADLDNRQNKHFAVFMQNQNRGLNRKALWSLRMEGPIGLAKKILDEVEEMGVVVLNQVKGNELGKLFEEDRVITLVAHSTGSDVEFSDKLYSNYEIARQVPEKFKGIIDLTVCNAFGLSDAIRAVNRNCRIVSNRNHTTFSLRMSLYKHIIGRMIKEGCGYLDALEKIRIDVLREVHSK